MKFNGISQMCICGYSFQTPSADKGIHITEGSVIIFKPVQPRAQNYGPITKCQQVLVIV